MIRLARKYMLRMLASSEGSILAEALVIIPVITIFSAGVLEFGNIFWQRQQLETGVRDAARYWSRCQPAYQSCSMTIARNLAFHGNPYGTGPLRVPGWSLDADLVFTPAVAPTAPDADDLVTVSGSVDYNASPVFGFLGIGPITIQYTHMERYIGW